MSGVNRIVRSVDQNSLFEDCKALLSSAVTFNQGDLLYLNTSTHLLSRLSSEGNAATFCGISRVSVTNGVENGPYTGLASSSQVAIGATPGPVFGVEVSLILKSGDGVFPGSDIYADPANGNFHVQASGTKPIGCAAGSQVAITGDGATYITVRLGARATNDVLKY